MAVVAGSLARARRPGRTSGRVAGRSGLPVAVVLTLSGLFMAIAAAGAASVAAVTAQDRLLGREASLATLLAQAGRAEALVAGLADPGTNPARLDGMRAELADAGRQISQLAGDLAAAHEADRVFAQVVDARGPQVLPTAGQFGREALLAAAPDADLRVGHLRRGSIDGLYPSLRGQVEAVRAGLVESAEAARADWVRRVCLVLAGAAGAGIGLSWLVLGPVRRRLLQQRRDAARLDEARDQEMTRLAAISRAVTAVMHDEDARRAVCEAVRDVTGGALAMLWEDDDAGGLVCTASAGGDVVGMRRPAYGGSVLADVFATARTRTSGELAHEPGVDDSAVQTLSVLCGRAVTGAVWVPVVSNGRSRAVLTVAFDEVSQRATVTEPGDRLAGHVPTLEILAGEAAIALDRQDLVRRLAHAAESDPLTGAANRRAWDTALPRAVYTSRATGAPMSVIVLDLDHFKAYNDTYGHPAGDAVLRQSVTAWRQALRPEDVLARYGGEEFAVILANCDVEQALTVAENLRRVMPNGQTCSAGIATLHVLEDAAAVLSRADHALYEAKRGGRNRCVAAKPPLRVSPQRVL